MCVIRKIKFIFLYSLKKVELQDCVCICFSYCEVAVHVEQDIKNSGIDKQCLMHENEKRKALFEMRKMQHLE